MPVDPEGAIKAVCEAVATGRIPHSRIRASVERIWQAKLKVCSPLLRADTLARPYSLAMFVASGLAQPAALTTATDILRSTQVVHGSVPWRSEKRLDVNRNLIVVDNLLACDFLAQHTPAIALPTQLGYTTVLSDCHTLPDDSTPAWPPAPTLLQLFIRGNPFRGSADLTQVALSWLYRLLGAGDLQALIIYGSPYVLEQFLPVLPPELPCVFSYGQMAAAQAIALKTLLGI